MTSTRLGFWYKFHYYYMYFIINKVKITIYLRKLKLLGRKFIYNDTFCINEKKLLTSILRLAYVFFLNQTVDSSTNKICLMFENLNTVCEF